MSWYIPPYRFPENIVEFKIKDVLSDITLYFGDKQIRAHKIVLALYCKLFENTKDKSELFLDPPDDDMLESYINILYRQDLNENVKNYEDWKFRLLMLETLKYLGVDYVDYLAEIEKVNVTKDNFSFFVNTTFNIIEDKLKAVSLISRFLKLDYDLTALVPYKKQFIYYLNFPTVLYITNDNELICENILLYKFFSIVINSNDIIDNIITAKNGKFFAYFVSETLNLHIYNFDGSAYKNIKFNNKLTFATISTTGKYICTNSGIYTINGDIFYADKKITNAVFSSDDKYAFIVKNKSILNVIDLENKNITYTYKTNKVKCIDLSINDVPLIVEENKLNILEDITGNNNFVLEYKDIKYAKWSPVYNHILISANNVLYLYNYKTNKVIRTYDFYPNKIEWSDSYQYIMITQNHKLIFDILKNDIFYDFDNAATWISHKHLIDELNSLS